jgi:hypothetical protein
MVQNTVALDIPGWRSENLWRHAIDGRYSGTEQRVR